MAREISDFNGTVIAPSVAYPYGDIKDNPSGTIVDSTSNSDLQQFAQKVMDEGNITPNGLPDNVTNGFQIFQGLQQVIKDTHPGWGLNGITFVSSGDNLWQNAAGYGFLHARIEGSLIFLAGVIENTAGSSPSPALPFTLPVALRPAYKTQIMCYDSLATEMVRVELNTTGVVEILDGGGAGGTKLFLDGTHYKIGTNTY
jgi:hypothetical protein